LFWASVQNLLKPKKVKKVLPEKYTLAYKDKLVASFCRKAAEWFRDMFCNFYFEKNHRIDNNSATTETREKNKYRFGFGILRFLGKF